MNKVRHNRARTVSRMALSAGTMLSGALMLAMPAMAQTAAPQGAAEGNVDDIIVTAQMRAQNVQDIPLAITAISGDQLEARSQTRLTDITAQAPNVILQQNPSGSGNSMRAYIRGVGQGDASPSVEPGVGIYVDDIYFGTVTASAFDLTDLERVEVLRGPQGTLAGMNSLGGAVKLYSRKPEGRGGYVELTAGSLNRRDIKASADFTVVPDAVFARITGVSRNRDGHVTRYDYACLNPNDPYVQPGTSVVQPGGAAIPSLASGGNCKLGTLGGQSMYAVRGSLRIAPVGSPLEINLSGDYTHDTSTTQASVLIASAELTGRQNNSIPYQGAPFDNRFVTYGQYRRAGAVLNDPYATYANFYDPGVTYRAATTASAGGPGTAGAPNGPTYAEPLSGVKGWGVSAEINYTLGDNLALKSITGYRKYDSRSSDDNDNSPIAFIGGVYSDFSHKQFSQELRLSGKVLDDAISFTIGGFYYDADTRYNARIHTPFSGFGEYAVSPCGGALPACVIAKPTFSFINDDTASLRTYAGFGNVAWNITPALTLEAGIRVSHEKKDYLYNRLNPNGVGDYLPLSNATNPLTGQVGTYKETLTDYRAALSYKITPDIMAYAQFATGFKGGGVAPRPYSFQQIRPFGAEKLKSYEIGIKADLFDRLLRINASGFRMDYTDYQGIPQVCLDSNNNPLPVNQGGVPGLCGQYLNIGDARVNGFELETTLRPVEGFTIDGSLSLTDFKFTSINYPTTSIVVGASRPGVGKWKWSLGAQYQADLGDVGTLTPRIDVSYTDGYCGDFLCTPIAIVDSYTLANARLTYETVDKDWSVALEVTNLFDKLVYLNKFTNAWYATAQPGLPRQWAVTVRRKF
ncbi:iron complex outermembrane receptor protein [Sphingobium sp. B2D3A]|uniref:TonB-dependent receptor n=1 Tax=unclassified Sphingobium TaxID=2611147 RepID=UPI0022255D4F|nr:MULTISPECIES: TonB-dependent receptor [unclassified Sphingobium]MCW2335901.1 iron complex outermembrane receptor protein [Sphingobium sp. B2D3A]MCW2385660.1 iron complex outermembrane receptor protein [Sphingobium sp. B2D3D]